ncbi:YbfB/YjiJ family MFS transporter [Azohydromonas australica]|uniref:YbfB/YjiJ family MFS transporter n=1 Tax=Azohydromonas australica TaxID=364039 RepID=UPI0003FB742F|nr:YbfB/YjiJ family MFS transporter [Azohydromonas australica]
MPLQSSTTPLGERDGSGVAALIAAGLCASLVGIGLARFAYTPLIPPLIGARWFSPDDVVFLAAANLLGYLLGAMGGRRLASAVGSVAAVRSAMSLTALAFLACAVPLSTAWFFFWRLLSGITGGVIMVLVGSVLLPHVPPRRKGMAAGAIFLGLGVGIAASGTLVPLLLRTGLAGTWMSLAAISLLLTIATWRAWPPNERPRVSDPVALPQPARRSLLHLYGQYGLMAVGVVPAMVFLVDYAARGLHWSVMSSSLLWVVFGVGALAGPLSYGALADRIGFRTTSRLTLALQVLAAATLALTSSTTLVLLSAFLLGTYPPGAVPIMLGRVNEAVMGQPGLQQAAWGRATMAFALVQAAAGYADSFLLTASAGNHRLLFSVAAGAFLSALLWDLLSERGRTRTAQDCKRVRDSSTPARCPRP